MLATTLRDAGRAWRDVRRFRGLRRQQRNIVFYAEDCGSWRHFAPVVRHLVDQLGREICYLTSDPEDPLLAGAITGVRAFYVGTGTLRTIVFTTLAADVMVMTMPDLQTFHIKRSSVQDVHYAYVFHALVSTHMVYRPAAFDAFDSVLCGGPHHVAEIRARERHAGVPAKQLPPHGYGALDDLLLTAAAAPPRPGCVVLAPSWGPQGLLENHAQAVIGPLLQAGWQVIVRPHPRTLDQRPDVLHLLRDWAGTARGLSIDTAADAGASWSAAELMISDWSGAALEYAFAFGRPVLFVDVPRKINNPSYAKLAREPLESSIRSRLGGVLPVDRLATIATELQDLRTRSADLRADITAARTEHVFHVGSSGQQGAAHIAAIADRRQERHRWAG